MRRGHSPARFVVPKAHSNGLKAAPCSSTKYRRCGRISRRSSFVCCRSASSSESVDRPSSNQTYGSSRRPTGTFVPQPRPDSFERTCSIDSTWPGSSRRPCASILATTPLLAQHFAVRSAADMRKTIERIAPDAIDLLQSYSRPGNVRELQHVVERAVVLSTSPELDVDSFAEIHGAVGDWSRRITATRTTGEAEAIPGSTTEPGVITLPSLNLDAASDAPHQRCAARVEQQPHACGGTPRHRRPDPSQKAECTGCGGTGPILLPAVSR